MVTGQESKGKAEDIPTSIRLDRELKERLMPLIGVSKKYGSFTHFVNLAIKEKAERELCDQTEGEK